MNYTLVIKSQIIAQQTRANNHKFLKKKYKKEKKRIFLNRIFFIKIEANIHKKSYPFPPKLIEVKKIKMKILIVTERKLENYLIKIVINKNTT